MNIIEAIQKKMGYPTLQRVDPNKHETKNDSSRSADEKLAQAAIPAVMTGIFKFTRTEEGADILLSGNFNENILDRVFEDKKAEAVDKVAHYSGVSREEAEKEMSKIADEAVSIIKTKNGDQAATSTKLRTYMSNQRHVILSYLPPAMQLGSLLEDDSLDDRTNKMEGPVSGFMHRIENILSGGGDSKYP